ncbi:hypothetical protein [Pseudomonas viridiflava]|uniref:hypothetical protein n=1 Tax=Pseudomonas viridiflava TaxID=33069 RepID=UPI0013CE50FD|nr:hypothetical protein [Pseudomonas viridiflava]
MSAQRLVVVFALLAGLVLAPIAFVFYQALEPLPYSIRLVSTGLVIIISGAAAFLSRHAMWELGAFKYVLLGLAVLLGSATIVSSEPSSRSSDYAQITYSNGTVAEGVKPRLISEWGRSINGYDMHPAYGAAVVPNSLVATFSSRPQEVDILLSKPSSALLLENGKPTDSDGVSVEIHVFDVDGKLGYTNELVISQDNFLNDKWIRLPVQVPAGTASIKITLGWGAAGSTPNYDSTIVGFQIPDVSAQAEYVGRVILGCVAAFMLSLFLYVNLRHVVSFRGAQRLKESKVFFYIAFVLLCITLVAYWSQINTSYVYFWDYRNYWAKTEVMYELITSGSWMKALGVFSDNYALDYSMVPTLLPALLGVIAGYPDRINYAIYITVLYAVPAYIMVAYLAKRLLDGEAVDSQRSNHDEWVLASLVVFLGLPLYFGTTLYLMPDVGGVILVVGALLSASNLIDALRQRGNPGQDWQVTAALFRSSISVGVLFSLMFIFRRWYVFAAAGIVCSLSLLVLIEVLLARGFRKVMIFRAIASAILMAFAALPFLCWILFVWARDFGQHDYANLYSSYKFSSDHDARVFWQWLGVTPILCLIGGGLFCFFGKARRLFFLLSVSTLISCVLFLHVQSPARHHYMLLMPLLGACLAGLMIVVARRFGLVVSCFLSVLLTLSGVLATLPASHVYSVKYFASFEDWLPKKQKYVRAYTELAQWLDIPENKDSKFCLIASSETINQGIFGELWQVVPDISKNSYDQRLIQLGQIDSVNGPPSRAITQCQIFLVGVPFQAHLAPDQQFTVGIIQKDMVDGTGIGRSVDRSPRIFSMEDGVEIHAYKQARGISDEEYDDLVRRFLQSKASSQSESGASH